MDSLEEWNQWVKDYLFNTMSKDYTKVDVLVQQIIDIHEDDPNMPVTLDYCALYDLDIEELVRILEREHNKVKLHVRRR